MRDSPEEGERNKRRLRKCTPAPSWLRLLRVMRPRAQHLTLLEYLRLQLPAWMTARDPRYRAPKTLEDPKWEVGGPRSSCLGMLLYRHPTLRSFGWGCPQDHSGLYSLWSLPLPADRFLKLPYAEDEHRAQRRRSRRYFCSLSSPAKGTKLLADLPLSSTPGCCSAPVTAREPELTQRRCGFPPEAQPDSFARHSSGPDPWCASQRCTPLSRPCPGPWWDEGRTASNQKPDRIEPE